MRKPTAPTIPNGWGPTLRTVPDPPLELGAPLVRPAPAASADGLCDGAADRAGFGFGVALAVDGRRVGRGVGFGVALGVGRGVGCGVGVGFGLCEPFGAAASTATPSFPSNRSLPSADAPKPAVSANATASDASHILVEFDITSTGTMPLEGVPVGHPSVPAAGHRVESCRWQM